MTDSGSSLGIDLSHVIVATMPEDTGPLLLVVVDTEEEFDWSKPFSRNNRGVTAISRIPALQAEFETLGVRPTYCLDYPVASTPASAEVFATIARRGTAEVGAHLHPWVTLPDIEEVTSFNSYGGNLDAALERAKLTSLAGAIRQHVGVDPISFKAGRYGIAPRTFDTLRQLGFRVDLSSAPGFNWTGDGGPDFSLYPNHPYWVPGDPPMLEIPTTGGMYGR